MRKSGYYKKIILTPRVITFAKGFYYAASTGLRRCKREKETTAAQKHINLMHALYELSGKLNNNFLNDDWYATLTYQNENHPEDDESFKKSISNFIRRLSRMYKKTNEVLKYVYVLEESPDGYKHVHMVLNRPSFLTRAELTACWRNGGIYIENVCGYAHGDDLEPLARYLLKTSFDESAGRYVGKRWYASQSLVEPEVVHVRISEKEVQELPV